MDLLPENNTITVMQTKRLIRFDWAIKTILRKKANFPILEGFLSELLHTDVLIESLLESESNKESSEDKSNRVDVLAQLTGGEKVIIEVQCLRQYDWLGSRRIDFAKGKAQRASNRWKVASQWDFLSRMLYGVSKVVMEHLKEGDPYGAIPRVISVNIVYFDLGHDKDYIYQGTTEFRGIHQQDVLLLDKKEKEYYPDHIDNISKVFPEYYVLKVGQFDLKIKDTLDEWMYALKESEVKPDFKAKGIQNAGKQLDILRLSEEERSRYDRHIGDVRDSQSILQTYYTDGHLDGEAEGLAKGLVKGKEEGEAKAKIDLIKAMHSSGLPIDQISQITNFGKEQIQHIIASI